MPLEFKANLIVRRTDVFCLTMITGHSLTLVQLRKSNKTGASFLEARICIRRLYLEEVVVRLLPHPQMISVLVLSISKQM